MASTTPRLPGLASIVTAALLALGTVSPGSHAAITQGPGLSAPGTFVWVGDHRLHVHCMGEGSPTVIFESGLGGTSLDWSLIQPEVARHTRACTYDRAGYGWSDRGPAPRHARQIVKELEQLLGYSSIAGPYVMVGHSFGGLNAQLFTRRNPKRVAGLVLVDSSHEKQFEAFEAAGLPSVAPRGGSFMLRNYTNVPSNMPPDVRPLAQRFAYASDTVISIHSELANMRRSAEQTAASAPLPDIPMAVVIHDPAPYLASPRSATMATLWKDLQTELAQRTSHSKLIVARSSDHYVQFADPSTVTNAIVDVVQQARDESPACQVASPDPLTC